MKTAAPGRCNGIIDRPAPTEAASRLFSVGYGIVNKYKSMPQALLLIHWFRFERRKVFAAYFPFTYSFL